MKTTISSLSALLIAGSTFLGCNTTAQTETEKPNVLFIIADDLNDWIGPYGGHPQVKTPNLDRLAANNAMVMLNSQCAAMVCGPSRAALLTGLRPSTSGVYTNGQNLKNSELAASVPTISQYFSQNGYFTLSTGKIFHKHGKDEGQWAFDLWEKERGGFPIDKSKLPLSNLPKTGSHGTSMDWGPTTVGKEETQDWLIAQWAVNKFQEEFDKPFLMMVGITRPHLPFYVPQEYFDMYDLESIIVPEFRLDDLDDILTPDGKKKFEATGDFLTIQEHDKFKEVTRAYLACVSYVDDCVGQILDGLENSQYKDNTIIVFIGDHGWFLGEKLRFRKNHLWEESCRAPMIIKVPGLTKTAESIRPVSYMDLYPTLAELCGIPAPSHTDGRSIVPVLKDHNTPWYPALSTFRYKSHSIRSEQYRYNVYEDNTEELYDHYSDPMEHTNLISDPKYASVVKELRTWLPESDAAPSPGGGGGSDD
jgi:arylsulfatase A-like enzyme